MSQGSARIDDPDVIRQFRIRLAAFDDACRNALLGVDAGVKRTSEWLKGEQQHHWKKELRSAENAVNIATGDFNRARLSSTGAASNAVLDAKKVLDKAKRRKENAETKLDATKRWAVRLTADLEKPLTAVRSFEILLDESTPKALSRLDRMVEKLEDYLRGTSSEKS